MFKLTVISGPNRGSSFPVQDGETTIGRQTGNTVVLQSSKVSKQHCVLVVNNGEVVVKDQGSSNGTFVNGILTKLKKIKAGDRISVGEFVLELVEPTKRKPTAAPAVAGFGNVLQFPTQGPGAGQTPAQAMPGMGASSVSSNQPPADLKGKIIWMFENRLMPVFYGLNLKHEWNIICLGLFAAFIGTNLLVSVYPLLEAGRATVIKEAGKRATFMAKQIAEHNAPFLAARMETKTEIGSVENGEGVRLAVLVDLDNRIIAPGTKLNQYLAVGVEANLAVRLKDAYRGGSREGGYVNEADTDLVVAVEPVKVVSPTAGKNIIVAMAIVSIDTSLSTPDVGEIGMIYSETFIMTGILGGIILLILYRITLKPFQVLNEDMDKALKGELPQVTHEFKFQEMNALWEIINSAIQRIPKTDGAGAGNISSSTDPSQMAEEFIGPLKMIGNIIKFGLVIFDSEKKILYLNPFFEEASGIRADGAIGNDIAQVARDQSMGPFTVDILGRAPVGGEGVSEDYEMSGITYKMYAAAFGSPGAQAKCYIMAATRVEG